MFERYQLVLNSKQFEDIKRSFTQGRAAHAYIIEGPAGAGCVPGKEGVPDLLKLPPCA